MQRKIINLIAVLAFFTLTAFAIDSLVKHDKELQFCKEANSYKRDLINYYVMYLESSEKLIDELECNNMLPDESENLEDMIYYKEKIDSLYQSEL